MLGFLVNTSVGIILLPYLVNNLGVEAYAIIPLTTFMIEVISLLTNSLSASIARNISVLDQNRKDYILTTSNISVFIFLIFNLLIATPIIIYFDCIFDIGQLDKDEVQFLVVSSFIVFTSNLLLIIAKARLISINQMQHSEISRIISSVIRFLIVFFMFKIFEPNLYIVGFSTLASSSLGFIYIKYIERKTLEHYRFSLEHFDRKIFNETFKVGLWVVINQLGLLLFMKLDMLWANKLVSLESVGELNIVNKLSELIRLGIGVVAGVAMPLIYRAYKNKDKNNLIIVSESFMTLIGFIVTVAVSISISHSDYIINKWIGESYTYLTPTITYTLILLPVNLIVLPMFNINLAYNRVKLPAIITLVLGAAGIILNWGFYLTIENYGLKEIVLISVIILTFKNSIFMPIYTSSILGTRCYGFYYIMFKWLLCLLVSVSASHYINGLQLGDLFKLTFSVLIIIIISLIFLGRSGLSSIKKILSSD